MDKAAKQEDGVGQEKPKAVTRSPNQVQIPARNVTKRKPKSRSKQRKQTDSIEASAPAAPAASEPSEGTARSESGQSGSLKQEPTRDASEGDSQKSTVTKKTKSAKTRKVKKRAQKDKDQAADDTDTGTVEVRKTESGSEQADGAPSSMSARLSKIARVNQRIVELSKPRNPKTKPNNRRSRKTKEVRPTPEADYVRFLLRDPNTKFLKKNSVKATTLLGLTPSDLGISSQQAAAEQVGKPKPLSPSAGRLGRFGPLVGTDKQKLDKADTVIVAHADTFVDFARLNNGGLGEAKKQRSPTLLQKLSQIAASKTSKVELTRGNFRAEVKLPGIQNQNISLEFAGDVLIVVAYRPKDKKHNARKITELVEIPADVNVNNLRIGRRPNGAIWIEEWIADSEQDLKREMNFHLNEEYSSKPQSIAAAIVQGVEECSKAAAANRFSLGSF